MLNITLGEKLEALIGSRGVLTFGQFIENTPVKAGENGVADVFLVVVHGTRYTVKRDIEPTPEPYWVVTNLTNGTVVTSDEGPYGIAYIKESDFE